MSNSYLNSNLSSFNASSQTNYFANVSNRTSDETSGFAYDMSGSESFNYFKKFNSQEITPLKHASSQAYQTYGIKSELGNNVYEGYNEHVARSVDASRFHGWKQHHQTYYQMQQHNEQQQQTFQSPQFLLEQ